ncbi:MAG: (2Fe-2S)-binding protein [Acidobacteria bacterium RIFCSPLOWO2_12_FULL_59_11]|nr:MAG: (2Fe-2S)-binding protein [Acidobacteria bacterium RIFCSPLOWO2_12_FULL_59_11]
MKQALNLSVNGQQWPLEVEPHLALSECLREELALTGVRVSCNQGHCGACTVLLDGEPVNACMMLAVDAAGKQITTIEGLAQEGKLHPLQQAFIDNHGMQCGYCTPGMILSAKALLDQNPRPTEPEIREGLAGNLCRCGSYQKIIKSVESAAKAMETSRP